MNELLSTGSEYKDLEYLNFLPCNSQLNKTEKQFSTFTSWTSHLPFSTTLDAVLSSSPMNGWMAIETAFFVSRCISVIAISMTWDAVYLKEEKSEVTRGITQQKLKFLHYYTTYSSFAMPICTERGPTALAPVTLFHRRCVRHGLAFYFRGEGLAGPDFELPRKWGWSDVRAIHLLSEVRAEGLGECFQWILQDKQVTSIIKIPQFKYTWSFWHNFTLWSTQRADLSANSRPTDFIIILMHDRKTPKHALPRAVLGPAQCVWSHDGILKRLNTQHSRHKRLGGTTSARSLRRTSCFFIILVALTPQSAPGKYWDFIRTHQRAPRAQTHRHRRRRSRSRTPGPWGWAGAHRCRRTRRRGLPTQKHDMRNEKAWQCLEMGWRSCAKRAPQFAGVDAPRGS